jgi:hypothetical protein
LEARVLKEKENQRTNSEGIHGPAEVFWTSTSTLNSDQKQNQGQLMDRPGMSFWVKHVTWDTPLTVFSRQNIPMTATGAVDRVFDIDPDSPPVAACSPDA